MGGWATGKEERQRFKINTIKPRQQMKLTHIRCVRIQTIERGGKLVFARRRCGDSLDEELEALVLRGGVWEVVEVVEGGKLVCERGEHGSKAATR